MTTIATKENMADFRYNLKKECAERGVRFSSRVPIYFLPTKSGFLPVGIIDAAHHFEWPRPNGTVWKFDDVSDLVVFAYHPEFNQCEEALQGEVIDDYDSNYFSDFLFVITRITTMQNRYMLSFYKGDSLIFETNNTTGYCHFKSDVYKRTYKGLYFEYVQIVQSTLVKNRKTVPTYEYHKYILGKQDVTIGTGTSPHYNIYTAKGSQSNNNESASPSKEHEKENELLERKNCVVAKLAEENNNLHKTTIADCNGLYPDDIAILYMVDRHIPFVTPSRWNNPIENLCIPKPRDILVSLYSKGFLDVDSVGSGLQYVSYQELCQAYKKMGIGKARKKAELVEDIKRYLTPSQIDTFFPDRPYVISELGQNVLRNHSRIVFSLDINLRMHKVENAFTGQMSDGYFSFDTNSAPYCRFDIWSIEQSYTEESCIEMKKLYDAFLCNRKLISSDLPKAYLDWCAIYKIVSDREQSGYWEPDMVTEKLCSISVTEFLSKYKNQFPAEIRYATDLTTPVNLECLAETTISELIKGKKCFGFDNEKKDVPMCLCTDGWHSKPLNKLYVKNYVLNMYNYIDSYKDPRSFCL